MCGLPYQITTPMCNFGGVQFSPFDDSVTDIITAGAYIEGRFTGSKGIALETAVFINKLRAGNNLYGIFGSAYSGSAAAACPQGVSKGCANKYINDRLSGRFSERDPHGPSYPGGNVALANFAYLHTKLQLVGICGGYGMSFYRQFTPQFLVLGLGLDNKTLDTLDWIYQHPDVIFALTYNGSWTEADWADYAKVFRIKHPTFQYRTLTYEVVGDNPEGVIVGNVTNFLDYAFTNGSKPNGCKIYCNAGKYAFTANEISAAGLPACGTNECKSK